MDPPASASCVTCRTSNCPLRVAAAMGTLTWAKWLGGYVDFEAFRVDFEKAYGIGSNPLETLPDVKTIAYYAESNSLTCWNCSEELPESIQEALKARGATGSTRELFNEATADFPFDVSAQGEDEDLDENM